MRVEQSPLILNRAGWLAILSIVAAASCQHLESAWQPQRPWRESMPPVLVVADFDRAGWRTNLGDPFGGWDHDPGDSSQFCRPRLVDNPRVGETGYSLQLAYDVDSPNPAFNGFWMKLPSIPLHEFQVLSFAIKGDPDAGFTKRIKLELKDRRNVASTILDGIGPTWTRMRVSLDAFRGIEKVRDATEFVIVFDDQTVTQPVGTIYLDDVAFESSR